MSQTGIECPFAIVENDRKAFLGRLLAVEHLFRGKLKLMLKRDT